MTSKTSENARALLSAGAVRACADRTFAMAEANELQDWRLDASALPACADYVAATIRKRYPDLNVRFHARWRHFVFGGRDVWEEIAGQAAWRDAHARARAEFDLAITSVLLDAGAGGAWRYADSASGMVAARSEGLALASLRLFEWGGFSADPSDPLRADGEALQRLRGADLADAFQVSARNPLAGLEGRAGLINRLGARVNEAPDMFAGNDRARPGGLYDVLYAQAQDGAIAADAILALLLDAFASIWENRPSLDGIQLGDCWPHPQLGLVPLHKLSQWLAYSLIEPLERAGLRVTEIDRLTGLAEYRNGGLFIDCGVLIPRADNALTQTYAVSDPLVVGWRTLTVALLDRLAPLVRERLGVSQAQFPLARVLEGGTWAAGRALAREKRGGEAPFSIISDGTVF